MAGNAMETAKQENGSKVYFRLVIENSKVPPESAIFAEVVKVYPDLVKNLQLREIWMTTYAKQSVALLSYLGNNKGYDYSRDERDGFMNFIENIAKTRCGVSTKDNWDPADIYMVRKNKESVIRKRIDEITKAADEMANIYSLNSYMRELIQSKDLVPISLKAISKTKSKADLELSNMGKGKAKEIIFQNVGPLKCYLNFGTNSKTPLEIDNGEIAGQFKAGESLVNWQTRNFNMSTPRGGVQTDLTPTGKDAGAKIGKASADAIDDFFTKNYNKLGIIRPVNAGKDPHIPVVGKWEKTDIKYWVDFQKELSKFKVNNQSIDFGSMIVKYQNKEVVKGSWADILDYCIRFEEFDDKGKTNKYAGGRLSSKLTCMRWAYAWVLIEKNGLMQEWLKTLYYGAKKEFRDTNGPFIKIY
jgi:hypothetical protein